MGKGQKMYRKRGISRHLFLILHLSSDYYLLSMEKKTLPKVGHYEMMAEPFHCDFSGRLMMGHLGNALLNAADFHSNDRGFGMNYLNTIHRTWVLSRLAIELEEMPRAYDPFYVETWCESAMKYFTSRNYKIASPNGRIYGYGRSIWAMIDTELRKPADILAVHDGRIEGYVDDQTPCPIAAPSRVRIADGQEEDWLIHTHYSDIDINGHVNSVKYIDHVLDLWDIDWYETHRLRRIDVAYVAEGHLGDRLHLYRQALDNDGKRFAVRICKQSSDGVEKEVCRCELLFE